MHASQTKSPCTFHLPSVMLKDIETYALRVDRPTGWCVRMAWSLAAPEIERYSADDRTVETGLFGGLRQPQPVPLPNGTWRTIRQEAARLDRSPSWIVQQAWRIARPHFLETAHA
jgi:uncharacterized small protein (TIGR04563 family)